MIDKFSISFLLNKTSEADIGDSIEHYDVVASIENLEQAVDYQFDILNTLENYPQITDLKDGRYFIWATGDVWVEHTEDHENWRTDEDWMFTIDDFTIQAAKPVEKCEHSFVSATNEVIKSGEICEKCLCLR